MGSTVVTIGKIVFATALLLNGCQSRSESLFREAQRALAANDSETAARLFKEVTIAAPGKPLAARAQFELAQMYYLRLRDMDAARESFLEIIVDYPETPEAPKARELLAQLYERELDAPEKALTHYEVLLADEPDARTARRLLLSVADCHYRLDRIDASARAYRRVLALPYHPDTDAAYLRLATLEWIGGSADESLRLLRELQAKSPSEERRYEAAVGEIELLARLGRFAEARVGLRALERDYPDRFELDELRKWVKTAHSQERSLASDGAALEALQKTIRWGSGRRRRASPTRNKP